MSPTRKILLTLDWVCRRSAPLDYITCLAYPFRRPLCAFAGKCESQNVCSTPNITSLIAGLSFLLSSTEDHHRWSQPLGWTPVLHRGQVLAAGRQGRDYSLWGVEHLRSLLQVRHTKLLRCPFRNLPQIAAYNDALFAFSSITETKSSTCPTWGSAATWTRLVVHSTSALLLASSTKLSAVSSLAHGRT